MYETYCMNCEEEEKSRRKKENSEENDNTLEEKPIRLYKYIGETCRSVWERSSEHQADLRCLNPTSHLLKHMVDRHEEEVIQVWNKSGEIHENTF